MRIPERLKIGGHILNVHQLDKGRCGGEQGFYSHPHWESIVLNSGVPESSMAETFLHEIIEVIKNRYELNLEHKDLSVLSEVLFSIIRDNNLDFRKESKWDQRYLEETRFRAMLKRHGVEGEEADREVEIWIGDRWTPEQQQKMSERKRISMYWDGEYWNICKDGSTVYCTKSEYEAHKLKVELAERIGEKLD